MSSIHRSKSNDKCLFSQIVGLIPSAILSRCIKATASDDGFRSYSTESQLIAMLFGQLNGCYSLRDITLGINVNTLFLKELGLKQSPARSTMSDGNAQRDYHVYELLFSELITYYKGSFSKSEHYKVIEEIKGRSIKMIDSTTMTVCLNLIEWAKFRTWFISPMLRLMTGKHYLTSIQTTKAFWYMIEGILTLLFLRIALIIRAILLLV